MDKLRRKVVLLAAGCKCEICGAADVVLEDHHPISRDFWWWRWDLANSVCVCRDCHSSPATIWQWLAYNRPSQYAWLRLQKRFTHILKRRDLDFEAAERVLLSAHDAVYLQAA